MSELVRKKQRYADCSGGCGKKMVTYADVERPLCQKCREAARTAECQWCGKQFTPPPGRFTYLTCGRDCMQALRLYSRYGARTSVVKWPADVLKRMESERIEHERLEAERLEAERERDRARRAERARLRRAQGRGEQPGSSTSTTTPVDPKYKSLVWNIALALAKGRPDLARRLYDEDGRLRGGTRTIRELIGAD